MPLSVLGNAVRRRLHGWENRARLAWYCVALAGVGVITLLIWLLHWHVQASRLQMSYLLLVLGLAIWGGRGPAVAASIIAFLAYDWFFTKPVGNLFVSEPDEWFALGLFLVVGISTGSLAAGLKRSVAEAQRRTRETTTLYELSIAILTEAGLDRVLASIVDRLAATLGLRAVTIHLARPDGTLALAAVSSASPDIQRLVCHDGGPLDRFARFVAQAPAEPSPARPPLWSLPGEGSGEPLRGLAVPLALNGRPLGLLTAYSGDAEPELSDNAQRLLDAFAAHTALAVGRVRLMEEEKRARAAAESDRLKSIFLASISHDLRTPLTGIKTAAALLLSEPRQAARLAAKTGIDDEVDRLNHLLGNLIEMSRIEGGSAAPRLRPEDPAELLGAAAARFTNRLHGRRLQLEAPDDLPLVSLDAAQIDRVLGNLIENAIKFSPQGATITLSAALLEGAVVFRTHNTGAGIPIDEQRRVFDKFYRLRTAAPGVGGTGLGLAICKGIVEAHGGRIWIRNEDGGVAFYVALPLTATAAETAAARQAVTA